MKILFGSEGGTAIDVSENIQRQLRKYNMSPLPTVHAMDDIEFEMFLKEDLVIFVCSTTGQGEEPRCMKKFWRYLLRKANPIDMLSKMQFAVFGLGDSSYQLFNSAAKKLRKRLLQLGATEIYPAAFGDDQHYLGYDAVFHPWLQALIPLILQILRYNQRYNVGEYRDGLLSPLIGIEQQTLINVEQLSEEAPNAIVVENVRLTPNEYQQDIRLLQFRTEIQYDAGDILSVYPENDEKDVSDLIDILNWNEVADKQFQIHCSSGKHGDRLPNVSTVREILQRFVEPFSCPKSRYFFELLSYYTDNTLFRERLIEISKSQDDYIEYCYRPRRTALEVIKDFSPLKIPVSFIFEIFPMMKRREFSISSYKVQQGIVEITAGIISYHTTMKSSRIGVCSKWFQTLEKGQKVNIEITSGWLKASDDQRPILCISPGLGVAPMKSILEKRVEFGLNENYLFYGFRYSNKDFLYRDLFENWCSQKWLQLFTAPSRESNERFYVQDQLMNQKMLVWDLIFSKNCVVYLSGNSKKMPDDVKETLETIASSVGGMDIEVAKRYVKEMIRERRFLIETWS